MPGEEAARYPQLSESQQGWELGAKGMVNIGELLINAVNRNEPKRPIGSDQKVSGQVWDASNSSHAVVAPPANRQDLTPSGICVELGKRRSSPIRFYPGWESKPQGEPMELRVAEVGESECHPVIGWIEVESVLGHQKLYPVWFTRHHFTRKRADFQLVPLHESTCQKTIGGLLVTPASAW